MSFLSEARTKNLVGICAMVRKEKKTAEHWTAQILRRFASLRMTIWGRSGLKRFFPDSSGFAHPAAAGNI